MKFDVFSKRLKQAMASETNYAFAKRSGISEPLLRKYLSGASVPSMEKAWKMAVAANVSLDWLAGNVLLHTTNQTNDRSPLNQKSGNLDIHFAEGVKKTFAGFNVRLRKAMGDDTSCEFAKKSGLSGSSLHNYLKGLVVPSIEKACRMANAANVSLDWLASGCSAGTQLSQKELSSTDKDVQDYIPLYQPSFLNRKRHWKHSANILTHLAFSSRSLHKQGLNPNQLLAIPVMGDSMAGVLKDGDIVMIDLERNQLDAEAIYVVRLNHQLYAKRLQRLFDGSVRIINENKGYSDVIVEKANLSNIEIIGRVIWFCGWT
ncbi:S24 family peptidase [Pseudomonas proteolytica]|uniref:S24 family peptidase n=1 Tax=Pseudomonas proteolytica TaxID=219574 RepID=UPI0030EF01FC